MTTPQLKMLLFSHICSPQHITGAEKLLLFFATELRGGYECVIVVPNEGILSQEARARGIATIVAPYSCFYEMYAPGPQFHNAMDHYVQDNREELSQLLGILVEQRPQLIINCTCINLLPAMAAYALGIPVGWMITEQIQSNPYTSNATDTVNHYAEWIIGISAATLQPFRGGPAEGKTSILYPSWHEGELEREMWPYYRAEKRAEMGLDTNTMVVGYVSSDIYPNKGLEHFVHMAVELAAFYPTVRYMIAGKVTDPVYYNKCLQIIRGSGYSSRFYMNPFEMQIQKIYPALDLLVIPSLVEEGFGMTALEGLIFGKSVVTYASGGLNEIMQLTGNESNLVEKGNIPRLTHHVGKLLIKGDWLRSWGVMNIQKAVDAFGMESYRSRLSVWLGNASAALPGLAPAALPHDALPARTPLFIRGSGPTVYALVKGYRYKFPSEELFFLWGGSFSRVLTLQDGQLNLIPEGSPLGDNGEPLLLPPAAAEGLPAPRPRLRRRLRKGKKLKGRKASKGKARMGIKGKRTGKLAGKLKRAAARSSARKRAGGSRKSPKGGSVSKKGRSRNRRKLKKSG